MSAHDRPREIQGHAMLSDQRCCAIVTGDARVNWLCMPRADGPAIFAELLDAESGGVFSVRDAGAAGGTGPVAQSYEEQTLVLRTQWPAWSVTDFMDCTIGRAYQRAGRSDLVRMIEGRGVVEAVFEPRLDFARSPTRISVADGGLRVEGWSDPIVLRSPGVAWRIEDRGQNQSAIGRIDLDALGGRVTLELRFGTGNLRAGAMSDEQRLSMTRRFWSGWAASLKTPTIRRDALVRSALLLKGLCHGPTGAILAAATTSLPEEIGGVRNWDYRYCWPRDAAMTATALLRLGNAGHAMRFADFLGGVVSRLQTPDALRPIYTVTGDDLGSEAELGNLAGYMGSRPVRVGNAAANQVQLDVFGPIADMVAGMTEAGVPLSPDSWRLVQAIVRAVESRWREPDHGIWEVRGPRRHYVHSKVMCWHAVNRALVVHEEATGASNERWRALRDEIASDVLANGWSERTGAFTIAYGMDDLDAAALEIVLTGLLPAGDPRCAATVERVLRRLKRGEGRNATVKRYEFDDGLTGGEGGMLICTSWLAQALAMLGRVAEAEELVDAMAAQAGPTGLMAEQWCPERGTGLGNVPQAYSHLGLINAAVAVERAGRREA